MKFLKNYKSTFLLLGAMLVGSLLGIYVPASVNILTPVGDAFMNLLYCLIVPMVFVSLSCCMIRMKDSAKLKKTFLVLIIVFVVVITITATLMATGCVLFDPSQGVTLFGSGESYDLSQSSSNFLAAFTASDFYLLLSRKNLLALVVAALAFGAAMFQLQDRVPMVVNFFDQLEAVIMKVAGYVIKIAPIGIGAVFAGLAQKFGSQLLTTMQRTTILVLGVFLLYYVGFSSLLAYIAGGAKGLKSFWKCQTAPALTGLGTSSSAAALPVLINACNEVGVPETLSNLVSSLATNLYKPGGTMCQVVKIAVVGGLYGLNFADPAIFLKAIFVAVFIGIVAGSIPGGGYIGEIIIMSSFGFPADSLPIMILIATLYDPFSTCLNCSNRVSIAMLVTRFVEGKDWMKTAKTE